MNLSMINFLRGFQLDAAICVLLQLKGVNPSFPNFPRKPGGRRWAIRKMEGMDAMAYLLDDSPVVDWVASGLSNFERR